MNALHTRVLLCPLVLFASNQFFACHCWCVLLVWRHWAGLVETGDWQSYSTCTWFFLFVYVMYEWSTRLCTCMCLYVKKNEDWRYQWFLFANQSISMVILHTVLPPIECTTCQTTLVVVVCKDWPGPWSARARQPVVLQVHADVIALNRKSPPSPLFCLYFPLCFSPRQTTLKTV